MSRARAAAHHEWIRVVDRRTRRLSFWSLAGAAIAAIALGAAGWSLLRHAPRPVPGPEIATLRTVTGAVLIASAGESSRAVSGSGMRIRAGDRFETIDGSRAAFEMPGGLSVRLDRDTTTRLDSASRLILERGAVYIDAGPGAGDSVFNIDTSFGSVRHTGTQFEVRVDESALRVRVREGSVAVDAAGQRWASRAGEGLILARGRPPERHAIALSGPEWSWVSELAQPFRLEGATAPAFLEWVSREQGWRWEYDTPSLRARVERIVLHGSIEGLTPEEALAAVLPTCGLTSRREGARLIVSAAQ
jgi:ferric-dicitrate binding protein FerR (iron transport regulator)